jgi:hypothetical protein
MDEKKQVKKQVEKKRYCQKYGDMRVSRVKCKCCQSKRRPGCCIYLGHLYCIYCEWEYPDME